MENPIKMDDLGVPLFLETPTYVAVSDETCIEKLSQRLKIGFQLGGKGFNHGV